MQLKFRKFVEAVSPGIKRIVIFDFDDTLVSTPTPEEGKLAYQNATGQPWPHKGWWGNPESLKPPVFNTEPAKLNPAVANAFRSFKDDAQTYVVVMTGRIAKFENQVKEILNKYGIHPDEYFFRGQKDLTQHPNYPHKGDTYDYKEFVILNRLMNQEVQMVEIFDDREEHIPNFVQLGKTLRAKWPNLQSVIIHDVRQHKDYNL